MSQSENSRGSNASVLATGNLQLKVCRHGPMFYNVHDMYVGRSLDQYGEYSENEYNLLRQIIHPGETILDVGANIGAFTVPLGQAVGPSGRVLAFEPQRLVFQMLCANVMINNLTNVEAIPAAAGDTGGSVNMPVPDYGSEGNFGGISISSRAENREWTRMVAIDSFELSACHLIKVDVEGFEKNVLDGAVETIKKFRPAIYLENDRKDKSPDLIKTLMEMDYRLYWHLPALFNPDNFFGNSENLFRDIISVNMICLPADRNQSMTGFDEIKTPDDWFV